MPPAVETQSQPLADEEKKPSNIIYPPPEVRNIVDKTAGFVAKNGPDFESTIRQKESNNPKFNFLNSNDPYHAYYRMKVRDISENKGSEPVKGPVPPSGAVQAATQARQAEIVSKLMAEPPQIPKEPPPAYEFIADPPSISALELDIVKLTAQFVARNGRQFLTNLMNREQKNFHFDFLKPQHSLFNYFTKLLEQYTKIMIPPKDLLKKLDEESNERTIIMKQVNNRVEWIKHEESVKKKLEDEEERERVAYTQIDWHDFVVVETVDYQPGESGNFPAPTTPEEVGARVLLQQRIEQGEQVEMQLESDEEVEEEPAPATPPETMEDMEESSESEEEEEEVKEKIAPPPVPPPPPKPVSKAPAPLPAPPPPIPEKIIVKKDYDPKQKILMPKTTPAPDEYLISPITGEKIPASQVQQHMKVGLLDPRWVEQRDRQIAEKMNQESVYAPGMAIESSLKQLAERRTDIFGVGVEETAIGKKVGEEEVKKDEKVTWDGHTSSAEAVARAARMTVSLDDQIAQIHKVKGLVADESKEKIGPKISETPVPIPAAVPKPIPPAPVPVPRPQHVQTSLGFPMMGAMPVMQQPVVVMNVVRPGLMGIAQPTLQTPLQSFMAAAAQQQQMQQQAAAAASREQEEEPPSKKQKTEENLIPEHIFLQRSRGTVNIIVVVPTSAEKNEWKLNGQTIPLTLPLTDSAAVIKAKVHEGTNMPPGKQKLVWDGLFFKDQNSLAYYNVTDGAVIQVQVKERGGKKK